MTTDFQVGDLVLYVLLRQGSIRPKALYLPAKIVNITSRRIVIRLDRGGRPRGVCATSICRPEQKP